jgi:hypothetical protein
MSSSCFDAGAPLRGLVLSRGAGALTEIAVYACIGSACAGGFGSCMSNAKTMASNVGRRLPTPFA